MAIFGQVGFGQNLVVLGKIGPGRNSVESNQVDLDWNFFKSTLAQIWSRRPRPKFVRKSSKFIPCWNLASLAPTKNLSNSMVSALWTQVLKNLIWIYFMKNGFWILNLIQIFRSEFKLDLNMWIWIFKKFNLLFLKKCIWIENLIQLFESKMNVNWIIKNPIHDYSHLKITSAMQYKWHLMLFEWTCVAWMITISKNRGFIQNLPCLSLQLFVKIHEFSMFKCYTLT